MMPSVLKICSDFKSSVFQLGLCDMDKNIYHDFLIFFSISILKGLLHG